MPNLAMSVKRRSRTIPYSLYYAIPAFTPFLEHEKQASVKKPAGYGTPQKNGKNEARRNERRRTLHVLRGLCFGIILRLRGEHFRVDPAGFSYQLVVRSVFLDRILGEHRDLIAEFTA